MRARHGLLTDHGDDAIVRDVIRNSESARSHTIPAAVSAVRVARVGLVVFLANAVLLVLQLVAGRLLAPFIGVSLPTWTAIIGVFLAGISLGNAFGGRIADRGADERTLGRLLLVGAGTILLSLGIVWLLGLGSYLRPVPFYPRILLLTLATCFPPAFVLSLITPVAIKLQLPDVAHTGRVAGLVYALGTAGSLVGNFLTGFVLLAELTTYAIVLGGAGVLAVLALVVGGKKNLTPQPPSLKGKGEPEASPPFPLREGGTGWLGFSPALSLRAACTVVFVASFCSMALEIAASRLLAPHLGVSLYSWTGIIGVVLAGVMFGNWAGGRIADQSPKTQTLGNCLFLAGVFTLLTLIVVAVLSHHWDADSAHFYARWPAKAINFINARGVAAKIVAWAAILFLAPMYLLGTISPVATRLAVRDLDHAGRVAGRVYAWSCAGAIGGTFAAGWGGIPLLGGVNGLILAVAFVLVVLSALIGKIWRRPGELFISAIVVAAAVFGLPMLGSLTGGGASNQKYIQETNYYSIRVYDDQVLDDEANKWVDEVDKQGRVRRSLALDMLTHSYLKGWIKTNADGKEVEFKADERELGYAHEKVQAEFACLSADHADGKPKIMVIGGGGYTFPRWVPAMLPQATVEVVEIDPGVTEAAHRALGLPRDTPIITHNLDGRQFVQERAEPGHYQLIVQDAVNDLSVPYHIMTKEYNDAVKRLLTPDGVYLLTVIDEFEDGLLMRAAVRTMRESFAHVHLMAADRLWESSVDKDGKPVPVGRCVWVIFGSNQPFDREALAAAADRHKIGPAKTVAMPADELQAYLDRKPAPVLTDAYAPVENLISVVFRKR
jgi:spermidine synthase/MFS family permease